VGRLIPAGTGLAYHNDRRQQREEAAMSADQRDAQVELETDAVEAAIQQALNTSEAE